MKIVRGDMNQGVEIVKPLQYFPPKQLGASEFGQHRITNIPGNKVF